MWSFFRPALSVMVLSTLVLGIAYPLGITALTAVVLPGPAGGNLIVVDGQVVGARDVGQSFVGDAWLHGRPSATPDKPYNAAASSGSNYGPAHPALRERVAAAVAQQRASSTEAVPVDLVTASGSGLDPHISPAAARFQAARIAAARGMSVLEVQAAIDDATDGRFLGILGEPRVRVLTVNLALHRRGST